MAEVPVIINYAMIVDYYGRTIGGPYKIVGLASIAGLTIGGGPVYPPEGGSGGDKPPGIWGPGDPRPQPPINFPPGWVGGVPPGEKPPEPISPPVNWKAVWHPTEGWVVVGVINPDTTHPVPSSPPPAA